MDKKKTLTRCRKCKGTGFQKKKNIFTCKNCGPTYNCMYCENVVFKGLYEECDVCVGSGEISSSKSTSKIKTFPTEKSQN